jgi:DHA2 family multidrug resistance protein
MFMAILDVQVVATSLPTIQSTLDIPPEQMSWIQTTYLTAEVVAIPLTGLLTRVLSMRWLFVTAICVFTLASLGFAASESLAVLIAWRALQGFSGGTLIPAVSSAVFLLFPMKRQGFATALAGGACSDCRSDRWRLDHKNLFLALAVSGQRRAGDRIRDDRLRPLAQGPYATRRASDARCSIVGLLAVALATLEIALKEAPLRVGALVSW